MTTSMRMLVIIVVGCVCGACGGRSHDDADGDADADTDSDADGDGDADCPAPEPEGGQCHPTYTCCTANEPPVGGLCEGDLHCAYPAWESDEESFWYFDCRQGSFTISTDCYNGCEERATFAETCLGPDAEERPGSTVEIGPVLPGEPFRPFEDGELVALQTPELCTRVPYRIRIDGADPPACAAITASVTAVSFEPYPVDFTVATRCGESLTILSIVPLGDVEITCDAGGPTTIDLEIAVSVGGVGTATAHVRAEIACPDEELWGLHCPAFGII